MTQQSRLVLSRKAGESIQIGDDIIIDVQPDPQRPKYIKVGICAPRNVRIMRTELLQEDRA